MIDEKIIDWYKKQVAKGIPRQEILLELYQQGHTGKEVKEILEAAETPEKLEEIYERQNAIQIPKQDKGLNEIRLQEEIKKEEENKIKYKERERHPAKKTLSESIKEEYTLVLTLSIALVILIASLIAGGMLLMSDDNGTIIIPPNASDEKGDNLPPILSVSIENEFVGNESIKVSCKDTGIDYSSGCNSSTFSFFISPTETCPKKYSNYSKQINNQLEQAFLCAAGKDNEKNIGFSKPIKVYFDVEPPTTKITGKQGWQEKSFSVQITDSDNSEIKCFYTLSSGQLLIENKKRKCNSTLSIQPNQTFNEGQDSCILEAYAIDLAGNKGKADQKKFDIDLNPPTTQITSINPSQKEQEKIIVGKETIDIIGTVTDPNLKSYELSWKNGEKITQGNQPLSETLIATIELSSFQEGQHTLLLTATDHAGKQSTDEMTLTIQTQSCEPGTTETCSWLKGICKTSQRKCKTDGLWQQCDYQTLFSYQQTEIHCADGIDNDCDGKEDTLDEDCTGPCSNECTEDTCSEGMLYSCEDCDEDECLDLCDAMNCSESVGDSCKCDCPPYTTSNESSLPGACEDGIDNDCDGQEDCDDDDCLHECVEPCSQGGGSCDSHEDCCSNKCDLSEGKCITCNGLFDNQGNCEVDCGADNECDELQPGQSNGQACCDATCQADQTVIDCPCQKCDDGYCEYNNTCYHGISCSVAGWIYDQTCDLSDECSEDLLVTGKDCSANGCSEGYPDTCRFPYECDVFPCGDTDYYCSVRGYGYYYKFYPYEDLPEESSSMGNCDDEVDNDCDEQFDGNDPDC